jgi:hypothetical protein
MDLEPIKVVDGFVKGTILAAYDFARLTLYGLAIPFVRRSRNFWLPLIFLTKRLSSLTYLFLWIIVAAGVYVRPANLTQMILNVTPVNNQVWVVLVSAFIITIVFDLSIRFICLMISNRIRRSFYESLLRIATGIIFLGTVVIFCLPGFAFGPFSSWRAGLVELTFFVIPLGIILGKAFRARHPILRGAIAILPMLVVPYSIVSLGLYIYLSVSSFINPPPEDNPVRVIGYNIGCSYSNNQLTLTGYLSVEGIPLAVLSPHDLHVTAGNAEVIDFGRPIETAPNIVLTAGSYSKIALTMTPALASGLTIPSPLYCDISLEKDATKLWGRTLILMKSE